MTQKDRRMTTERCAHLCAVAIVNQLDEAWISINPVLLSLYFSQYAPSVFRRYANMFLIVIYDVGILTSNYHMFYTHSFNGRLGARVAMTLRDSRNDLVNKRKQETEEKTD